MSLLDQAYMVPGTTCPTCGMPIPQPHQACPDNYAYCEAEDERDMPESARRKYWEAMDATA